MSNFVKFIEISAMAIPVLESVKAIGQRYRTGEEPVSVLCSDFNVYVCKYMRSSAVAYKLCSEYVGARLAMAWQLNTPNIALVKIKPMHWEGLHLSHSLSALSLGSQWLDGVVDITPSTYANVSVNVKMLKDLLKIALFDFWTANEDRNANNANLMYDVAHDRLVSIDYGCILNTATFDYPLSQLTSTDTILCSDLFLHLANCQDKTVIFTLAELLKAEYENSLQKSCEQIGSILEEMPQEWKVPMEAVQEKLSQLHDKQWMADVWENFMECLIENTK